MSSVYLGLDTSCYTTSVALVDEDNQLLYDGRLPLNVEEGQQGLRQSEALFQHQKNLPVLFSKMQEATGLDLARSIKAIAVSDRPCPVEGSYMPVFLAGTQTAQTLSAVLKVPCYLTTHQEGHLMAALWGAQAPLAPPFLAFHLSGGTTELLKIHALEYQSGLRFKIQPLLETSDISAGQLIDRVGVALQLPFPSGPALSQLAQELGEKTTPAKAIPTFCKETHCSFAGAETEAKRRIKQGDSPAEIARAIEQVVATTVEKALSYQEEGNPQQEMSVLMMGGVSANRYLRQRLEERLRKRGLALKCIFAPVQYASDNGVGVALIAGVTHQVTPEQK